MKFKGSIDINLSRDKVTKLFMNPDSLVEYQDGFIKKKLSKDVPGKLEQFLKCITNTAIEI